jgi:hypothetical protein
MVSYFLIMQTIILVVVLGGLYFLFPRLWDTWYVPLAIGGGVFILASVAWFNLSWLNGTKRRGGGAYMTQQQMMNRANMLNQIKRGEYSLKAGHINDAQKGDMVRITGDVIREDTIRRYNRPNFR